MDMMVDTSRGVSLQQLGYNDVGLDDAWQKCGKVSCTAWPEARRPPAGCARRRGRAVPGRVRAAAWPRTSRAACARGTRVAASGGMALRSLEGSGA